MNIRQSINFNLAIALFVMLLVSGCGTTGYDPVRYQNLVELKAYHIKHIMDHTKGTGGEWNEAEVNSSCQQGEMKFKNAYD